MTVLPSCSVVVCTRDRPEALNKCLAAVMAGRRDAAEVVVVDSSPSRAGAEQVAARWGARYIRETQPGLSRARNRAAHESTSDILAFIDDDAIPEAGWLEPLLAEFVDPKVGLVAGRVLPPDADMKMLPAYGWFGIGGQGPERKILDRSVTGWYEKANFDSILLGANMAFRKAVFEAWPGFDERLGAGARIPDHEETKASFELLERGYRLVYTPRSLVVHAFPNSKEELKRRALRSIEASAAYLALLLVEQPAYRKQTLGYISGKLGRLKPLYRRETAGLSPLVPGYRVLAARLNGVFLYLSKGLFG